jgi:branched-chain amino acid transport system ATP-binding protein
MNERALLEIEDLAVSYGPIRAVQGVSFEIARGETVALIGVNGAGKSSLLKAIAGLVVRHRGSVRFAGQRIDGLPAHRVLPLGVTYVPEGRMILGTLTVRENLRLGAFAAAMGTPPERRIGEVLAAFPELAQRLDEPASALSGGEGQLLALARGLIGRPTLLLLDEPALGLSPKVTARVFALIEQLKSAKHTMLIVDQNVSRLLGVADRAFVMSTGGIVLEGAARALARDPMFRASYLGLPPELAP